MAKPADTFIAIGGIVLAINLIISLIMIGTNQDARESLLSDKGYTHVTSILNKVVDGETPQEESLSSIQDALDGNKEHSIKESVEGSAKINDIEDAYTLGAYQINEEEQDDTTDSWLEKNLPIVSGLFTAAEFYGLAIYGGIKILYMYANSGIEYFFIIVIFLPLQLLAAQVAFRLLVGRNRI